MEPYIKPLPEISEANKPFWAGTAAREFRVPRCADCGDFNWPPYPACRTCLSEDQHWTKVSGAGSVYSYSIVHRAPGAFGPEAPYILVLVELDARPRSLVVLGRLLTDPDPSAVHIGMRVAVSYEDIPGEDVTLYRFKPLGEGAAMQENAG